jgi:hypothetical protein
MLPTLQHRGTDDQRRQHEPHRDPVGDLLETGHEAGLVDGLDLHLELVIGHRIEDLVDAARESLDELLHLEDAAEEVPRRRAFEHTGAHDLGGIATDRGVRIELRIQRLANLIEIQERLAEHRELGRQPETDVARHAPESSTTLPI